MAGDFSVDVRGDKEFQRKMAKLGSAKVCRKIAEINGRRAELQFTDKIIRAGGGPPVKLRLTRRSGGGSITKPHLEINETRGGAEARLGMTGKHGELMKMHEHGGWFQRKRRAMSIVKTRKTLSAMGIRYHLPARPSFKRLKMWAEKTLPADADKTLKAAIKAAGLK